MSTMPSKGPGLSISFISSLFLHPLDSLLPLRCDLSFVISANVGEISVPLSPVYFRGFVYEFGFLCFNSLLMKFGGGVVINTSFHFWCLFFISYFLYDWRYVLNTCRRLYIVILRKWNHTQRCCGITPSFELRNHSWWALEIIWDARDEPVSAMYKTNAPTNYILALFPSFCFMCK